MGEATTGIEATEPTSKLSNFEMLDTSLSVAGVSIGAGAGEGTHEVRAGSQMVAG